MKGLNKAAKQFGGCFTIMLYHILLVATGSIHHGGFYGYGFF